MVSNLVNTPSRGASRPISRKNVAPFRSQPIIGWTIDAAVKGGVFGCVLVSTDCAKIAEISFLRDAHEDDQSPVSEAVITALGQPERHYALASSVTELMPNCSLRGGAEGT